MTANVSSIVSETCYPHSADTLGISGERVDLETVKPFGLCTGYICMYMCGTQQKWEKRKKKEIKIQI